MLTRRASLNIIRGQGIKSLVLTGGVTVCNMKLFQHSYSSVASPTAPKTLKPSKFAQPSEPTIKAQPGAKPEVPEEDLNDFLQTKLVNGHTDKELAITDRASQKLTTIAREDNNPDSALKISVESGGCHGFQYNLILTNLKEELSKTKELLVFERQDEGNAKVVIDEASLEILQESKVDYTKELIGSSFKIVDSPYTSTECGCGASFDFDFEKLEERTAQKHK